MKLKEIGKGIFRFWCPGCNGHHSFHTPSWKFDGNMDRPTVSPSLKVTWEYGPERVKHCCHFFIRLGRLEYLHDCTHALKGTKVDLPHLPE